MTALPSFRRERDWSLSHRRLAQSRVGDVAALHKLAGSSVMYITVAVCLGRLNSGRATLSLGELDHWLDTLPKP